MSNLEELNSELSRVNVFIKNKDYERAVSSLPTDIRYLRLIMDQIDVLKNESRHGALCWLMNLLSNPFTINMSKEEIETIVRFLLDTSVESAVTKLSLKCLAMLVFKTDARYSCTEEPEFGLYIHGIRVSEIVYYTFLSHLSKLRMIETETIRKSDSVTVKRMKVKIMSNHPSDNTLRALFSLMNEKNTKLGWTLCKSFFRVAKHFEMSSVVMELKKRCRSIFANEDSWINIVTILGIMILDGWDIGDISHVVSEAINYNNELVYNSERVREAALFLLWASVRSGVIIEEKTFHLMIAKALFDSSLPCRRSAAAVILEYIGRCPQSFGGRLLTLVNFRSVKRLETCSDAVEEIMNLVNCGETLEETLIKNILHYKLETKEQSGYCISRYFHGNKAVSYVGSADLKTPSDFSSVLILIREFIKQRRTREIGNLIEIIVKLRIDMSFSRCKDFDMFTLHYVEVIAELKSFGNEDVICENLYFLLAKNILSEDVSRTAWKFIEESKSFADRLFAASRRNTQSFILVNAKNFRYRNEIEKRYMDILERGSIDSKIHVMKAVRYTEMASRYKEHICAGLENYFVDFRGDVSAELRKESLLASFIAISDSTPSKYFVRYFVDKSKMLRDECILVCKNNGIFGSGFEYIQRKGNQIDTSKLKPVMPFLTGFYSKFKELELISDMGNDKMFFAAAIAASEVLDKDYYREFVLGILGTIGYSDASLHFFVLELLFEDRKKILNFIIEFFRFGFENQKRMIYPTLVAIDGWIGFEARENLGSHDGKGRFLFTDNIEIKNSLSSLIESFVLERDILVGRKILDAMNLFRFREASQ